ncbi:hypothetical protein JQ636_21735 [Bradyrhizobium japonicum]|uniref:hypothetical protein n=1 Tax=Bradyrhizobium japonicum TaxID=375 RepID=UPI001BA78A4D|nr:hypothetical protein [Bradyrhizobium japonicum]MBR0806184.1 hypothetical protein [Bradyrhizobium japonicum]
MAGIGGTTHQAIARTAGRKAIELPPHCLDIVTPVDASASGHAVRQILTAIATKDRQLYAAVVEVISKPTSSARMR